MGNYYNDDVQPIRGGMKHRQAMIGCVWTRRTGELRRSGIIATLMLVHDKLTRPSCDQVGRFFCLTLCARLFIISVY